MLIVCTSCATSYQVAPGSLGEAGRSVRCVRCGNVWFAANTGALAAIAETHRADVAAFAATTSVADFGAAAAAGNAVAEAPPRPGPAAAEPTLDDDAVVAEAPAADGPDDAHLAADTAGEAAWTQAPQPDTIADAPALVPAQIEAAPLADASPTLEDIESVAARRARRERRARRWSLPGLSTAILMLGVVNISLVGWRADVVRWLPQTASLYAAIGLPVNLRGLVFADVKTEKETHDGVPVLVVAGTIVSKAPRVVEVPRLRFAVRNDSGQEVYTWTALPTKGALRPGETLSFRSRLASPPREGNQVLVRFFNRRDLA
ncbi:MAG: hypothetical protein QOC56_2567, partial [Alphaproteobacteria bacterium]|nr:hypothetical protein [Alphaproteobacteria bacterium]